MMPVEFYQDLSANLQSELHSKAKPVTLNVIRTLTHSKTKVLRKRPEVAEPINYILARITAEDHNSIQFKVRLFLRN